MMCVENGEPAPLYVATPPPATLLSFCHSLRRSVLLPLARVGPVSLR